jgi:hypothetical protein
VAGDDVFIRDGLNILYDMEEDENYILNSLTIDRARLSFEDGENRTLLTKNMWNRGGQLYIGDESNRITVSKIKIVLVGASDDEPIDVDNIGDPGNKVFVNTGQVKWYGAERDGMTMLMGSVEPGEQSATVATGLDWVAGDELFFAPTGFQQFNVDYLTVDSYDSSTGDLTLTSPFSHYHYGADSYDEQM